MPSVEKTTVDAMPNYGRKVVGTTAMVLCEQDSAVKGVLVKALADNTNTVYVGTQGIKPTTALGFPLEAGATVMVETSDPRHLWVIADAADQGVAWFSI